MATVINTPSGESTSSGTGFLLGVTLLLLVAFVMFYYGMPALRNAAGRMNGGVNVTVPKEIDVNVNTSNQSSGEEQGTQKTQ